MILIYITLFQKILKTTFNGHIHHFLDIILVFSKNISMNTNTIVSTSTAGILGLYLQNNIKTCPVPGSLLVVLSFC